MKAMALNLSRLNPRQREAVLHGNGPLLILAGAGSGKTSTMTYRIAHLIAERHQSPTSILGLSFTNKAAAELKERVRELVQKVGGASATRGLTISTFHSLCARLLREHADKLGFQKNFTILDQNDQTDVLKQVYRHLKIDDRKFDLGFIAFEIGQAKNRFLGPEEAERFFLESGRLSGDYAVAASVGYARYQEQLRALNAMDFDDLLFQAVRLLDEHEAVRAHYNARFRHILVDEYQDTNQAQFRLLKLLTERSQNICVVGDDDQSIYSWRGADPTHILGFGHHFPEARTITLDQNYRSTNTILEAANQVIKNNRKRHPKSLWSDRGEGEPLSEIILEQDRDEAEYVSEEILRRAKEQDRPWKDFAVLYRSNAQSRLFEESLRRNQIPYKIVGGMSFLDRKEVKDVLSYWRLAANPDDDASLRRIINWPSRGIGRTTLEALGQHAFAQGSSVFPALNEAPRLLNRGSAPVVAFRDLLLELKSRLESSAPTPEGLAGWARFTLERIQARKAVHEDNEDPVQAERKWENVEELVHSLGQMRITGDDSAESSSSPELLREFLSRMALNAQEEEEDKKERERDSEKNQATLLTLHGSKGLEFPVVFMVGMEDGYLPHQRTLEEATDLGEERRLCYVGITRARDHLILTRTKNRIRYGKPVPRVRSRFLEEVPPSLIVRRDESQGPDLSSQEAQEQHEAKVKNFLSDIRAKLLQAKPT
jgi:superfamily I DNA/RNA helicase